MATTTTYTRADDERGRLRDQLDADRDRLSAALRRLTLGVVIVEAPTGQLLLRNDRASAYAVDDNGAGHVQLFHLDGRPCAPDETPLARALNAGEVVSDEELRATRRDGDSRLLRVDAAPIRDRDGDVVAAVALLDESVELRDGERRAQERAKRYALDLSRGAFAILRPARDSDGQIVDFQCDYLNPPAAGLLRNSVDALLGRRLLEAAPGVRANGQFERFARVVETGEPDDATLFHEPLGADGQSGWVQQVAFRLGDCLAIASAGANERRQAERARQFLANATAILSASLDYEDTLAEVVALTTPAIADGCLLDIFEPATRSVIAHVDPRQEQLAREIRRRYPLDLEQRAPIIDQLRAHGALFEPQASQETFARIARDDEHRGMLAGLVVRSSIAVPLIVRERMLGVMTLIHGPSEREFDEADLALARELAHRAAQAIDNARLYTAAQTAQERARRQATRLAALAHASRVLAEASLDLSVVLDAVAQLVVDALGDVCLIRLLSSDGQRLELAAVCHVNPQALADLQALGALGPRELRDGGVVGRVARTGESIVLNLPPNELRSAINPAFRTYQQRHGLHTILVVPLRARGRVIGTLGGWRDVPGKPYDDEDRAFLEELAARAALAIDNAQLFTAEREARAVAEAAQRRAAFLAEASDLLNASLDVAATLGQLAQLAVPALADVCLVDAVEPDGVIRRLAAAHADAALNAALMDMVTRYPPDPAGAHPVAEAVREGKPRFMPDLPADRFEQIAHDEEHLRFVRELAPVSGIHVPLIARGRTLGALELLRVKDHPRFVDDDLATAVELARRAAVAVDNARLYRVAQAAEAEARRAAGRLRVLAEVSRELATAGFDIQAVLESVVRHVAEEVGDGCSIRLLSGDGRTLRSAFMRHADPDADAFVRALNHLTPTPVDAGLFGRVLESGEPLHIAELPDAELRATLGPDYTTYIDRFGMHSVIIVPLRNQGQTIGALGAWRDRQSPPYSVDDRHFLQELADRAAVAVQHARLYRTTEETRARYRALFEAAADAILIVDRDGDYLEANPAAERMFGYTLDDLRALRAAGDTLNVGGQAATAEAWERVRAEGEWRGEMELRRRDGGSVPVEASVRAVQLPDGLVYMSTLRDISERRAIDRMQQEFMAMVTHELKGPLTSVRGFAQLMRRRGGYNARGIEVILNQADHLERLINDLLDAARLDAGRMELVRGQVDLTPVVLYQVEQAQALASDRIVRAETPLTPLVGCWDADRVGQVLRNLLSNAVKYSPAGQEIVVRVEDLGAAARVSVIDHGAGIPPEALPRLFSRFFRVAGAGGRGAQGLGLGLYISRSLVEAHDGSMAVESVVGAGSVFSFTLPYAAVDHV